MRCSLTFLTFIIIQQNFASRYKIEYDINHSGKCVLSSAGLLKRSLFYINICGPALFSVLKFLVKFVLIGIVFRPITALNYKRISKLSKNNSFISFLSLLGIVITELFIPTAPFLVQK